MEDCDYIFYFITKYNYINNKDNYNLIKVGSPISCLETYIGASPFSERESQVIIFYLKTVNENIIGAPKMRINEEQYVTYLHCSPYSYRSSNSGIVVTLISLLPFLYQCCRFFS